MGNATNKLHLMTMQFQVKRYKSWIFPLVSLSPYMYLGKPGRKIRVPKLSITDKICRLVNLDVKSSQKYQTRLRDPMLRDVKTE